MRIKGIKINKLYVNVHGTDLYVTTTKKDYKVLVNYLGSARMKYLFANGDCYLDVHLDYNTPQTGVPDDEFVEVDL